MDSMRGGGNQAEWDLWRAAHVSKRLAQLRIILDKAGDKAGVRENYRMLADVQRRDPHTVAELLSGPQVGAWAALCVRLLAADAPESGEPLWTHLAHLGSIAAAAGMRAGRRVRVHVPVRAGTVHFPMLGRAIVASAGEPAHAECDAGPGGILVDGAPPVAWEPVHLLQTESGGVPLTVQLDDVDPYWSSFGLPTATRLTEEAVEVWRGQLAGAWRLLAERHAHRLGTMAAGIRCLVPVEQAGRLGGVSASSVDAPGAVALTEPVSPVRLAATLIHESQHYRLATLHDLKDVYETRPSRLHYSPWRNDPRPLSGVVHAIMAFTGVADFWWRERTDPATELEYARHIRQLHVARRLATGAPELTPLGAALVDALGNTIDELPLATGSEEVRRLAEDLVTEHQTRWRLRNITPQQQELRAFHEAWRTGVPPPTRHSAHPKPGDPSGDNPLTRVAMAWLENKAELQALTTDEALLTKRFPGAARGDVCLVAGDYRAARDHALTRIADGNTDDHTWATLVVAHGHACAEPTRSPLVCVPELVRAAFAHLAPNNDTRRLTELLSRYEAGTSTSDSIRR